MCLLGNVAFLLFTAIIVPSRLAASLFSTVNTLATRFVCLIFAILFARRRRSAYYYTYTVAQPDQPKRRLYSVFALLPTGQGAAGMNLVSITGQCFEDDVSKTGGTLEAIVASFKQK